jgi:hypothetical protein
MNHASIAVGIQLLGSAHENIADIGNTGYSPSTLDNRRRIQGLLCLPPQSFRTLF